MKIKNIIVSYFVGLLFSVGLSISGMLQPQKVIGFLNLFYNWDPSLILVMIGAIAVHSSYYFFIKPKFSAPLFTDSFQVPNRSDITSSLIIGASIFGIGWGLGGYCPGPALTSVANFSLNPFIFLGAMLVGMALYRKVQNRLPFTK
ncbi:MAG: hypothetical protein RJB66_858 [Pseudomonadota bacterium]|jgi:uncharacterized membrane protein YedE/YeeE